MGRILDSSLWIMIIFVSLLGVVTKLAYYNIGKRGRDSALEMVPKITPERWERFEASYQKRGPLLLLFASIPVMGSAITATAGAFKTRIVTFIVVVLISNLIRNGFLVYFFGQTMSLFPESG